jgi:hypothetical protein
MQKRADTCTLGYVDILVVKPTGSMAVQVSAARREADDARRAMADNEEQQQQATRTLNKKIADLKRTLSKHVVCGRDAFILTDPFHGQPLNGHGLSRVQRANEPPAVEAASPPPPAVQPPTANTPVRARLLNPHIVVSFLVAGLSMPATSPVSTICTMWCRRRTSGRGRANPLRGP